MAVNYTVSEAAKIIAAGNELEKVQDIGRRFPIASMYISKVVKVAEDDFLAFLDVMPEYLTLRKVESGFKAEALSKPVENVDDEGEEAVEKSVKNVPEKRMEKAEPAEESEDDEAVDDEYAGKTAMELFKLCKSRKLKAAPKKTAKYYIDLLKKDDAAKAEASLDDDDDDDWDI